MAALWPCPDPLKRLAYMLGGGPSMLLPTAIVPFRHDFVHQFSLPSFSLLLRG